MSACRSGNISVSNTEPNVSDGTQSTEGTLATGPADSDVDPTVPSENDRPTKPTVPDEKKPEGNKPTGGDEDSDNTEQIPPDPDPRYHFQDKISQEVLCRYLARAVTISVQDSDVLSPSNSRHIKKFILDTGAKYICRAATCWNPTAADYRTYQGQQEFIESVHMVDPDVVFEACVFECVSAEVDQIPIPDWVFRAFDLPVEDRCFSFQDMCFSNGAYVGQWGEGTAVPDITRLETKLFIYYRACAYIKLGFEGIHFGQVHLMGQNDVNWASLTQVINMVRDFAKSNARRGFVFMNAHTHGVKGSDGKLLFDFHMYPSRPMADGTQEPHRPTEADPQRATFDAAHYDSIYGKSSGGITYSGWECDSLPYLVELDNYGNASDRLNIPNPDDMWVWGMDEIGWFANQPGWYRAEFLEYAYDWVKNSAPGDGFFAMPGQRVAQIYDSNGITLSYTYMAYDPSSYPRGMGDASAITRIWKNKSGA